MSAWFDPLQREYIGRRLRATDESGNRVEGTFTRVEFDKVGIVVKTRLTITTDDGSEHVFVYAPGLSLRLV